MRRPLLAFLMLVAPARAAPEDRTVLAEARLAALERQRQAQQARLAQAQAPLVRLLAAVERLALRPPALALAEPRSIDDMIHARALLDGLQPALAARTAGLRRELAETRALRAEAMRTLRDIEAGRSGLARTLNTQLARLETPPLRPSPLAPEPAPAYRPPVAGQLAIGTGERSETGWRSRGLTLLTAPGAKVVAPAYGRIGYAGPFGGYGEIVILDHGHGWTTLLTGLGKAQARTGAMAVAGAPLGRMGEGLPRLTIELRHHGRTIDVAGMMVR